MAKGSIRRTCLRAPTPIGGKTLAENVWRRIMIVDLAQLRTFVAVAEEQHLTRAAERLHISMSAASAHIRAIEERLDLQLFVRTNRNLVLTRSGQLLVQKAKILLSEAAQFTTFARECRGKMEGTLSISLGSEPVTRVGEIVAQLKQMHPLITVSLFGRASLGGRQGLNTGELDSAFLLGGGAEVGLTRHDLATLHFRIAGPIELKEKIERADWDELACLPWISPIGSTAYTEMQNELFRGRGLELNSVAFFDNAVLGRTMLHAGVGLMLIREESALQSEREGVLAISPIARAQFRLYLAHLSSRANDPLIEALVHATRSVWPVGAVPIPPGSPA
jgi:DNA-binding transcriptional LysR family regulator